MPRSKTSRRLLGLVQRTAKAASAAPPRSHVDGAALWSLQETALVRTREASEASQRIASNLAKQRASADVLTDRAHAVAAHAQELGGGLARITDAFERLSLVALNVGLEGARLGEAAGRPLLLVSEEVRSHVNRGTTSARELTATLGDIGADVSKLHGTIDQARQASSDASQEASRVSGSTAEAERTLVELGARLREATGNDPETVRLVTEAGDHARALMTALTALRGKVPKQLLLGALRPLLDPLARVLGEAAKGSDRSAPDVEGE
jgi:methyl-accepting chemotaxis protein